MNRESDIIHWTIENTDNRKTMEVRMTKVKSMTESLRCQFWSFNGGKVIPKRVCRNECYETFCEIGV